MSETHCIILCQKVHNVSFGFGQPLHLSKCLALIAVALAVTRHRMICFSCISRKKKQDKSYNDQLILFFDGMLVHTLAFFSEMTACTPVVTRLVSYTVKRVGPWTSRRTCIRMPLDDVTWFCYSGKKMSRIKIHVYHSHLHVAKDVLTILRRTFEKCDVYA